MAYHAAPIIGPLPILSLKEARGHTRSNLEAGASAKGKRPAVLSPYLDSATFVRWDDCKDWAIISLANTMSSTTQHAHFSKVALSNYGHWRKGRFSDLDADVAKKKMESAAERFELSARYHLQARCVQLARMGCVVFFYDMEGYADSVQLVDHKLGPGSGDPDKVGYLLFSPEAELHGQSLFGLQTGNSIRAVDFISSLPDVDPDRIGVTGASDGGTQSMILGAVDERIAASMPAVMVSQAMQGGCVCENAQYLRINQGNVDIAAATAPRRLGLLAANDWTRELETKSHPNLKALYQMLGHPKKYEAHFHLQFPHNYNSVNRHHMYSFMNRHLNLGLSEPIVERPFVPLDKTEAPVWTDAHPKPTGEDVGPPHERELTAKWTEATKAAMAKMEPEDRYRAIAEGITTMVGHSLSGVGPIRWDRLEKVEADDYLLLTGTLTVTEHNEQRAWIDWHTESKAFRPCLSVYAFA